MRILIFTLLLFVSIGSDAQYIGVRARYTDTRLVDDSPNPPKRENRLVLSFFTVTFNGTENVWTPTVLSNYDLWVYKSGLQYGNGMGGVLDSTGNNYPGYAYPAPKAVAYYNTLGLNYIDCDPNAATHFVVNGHELDCGFILVSYWDVDWGTMVPYEAFTAPNICLPYYWFEHPYYFNPGNVNFDGSWASGPPYNMYNFFCGTGVLNLVIRGVIGQDTGSLVTLPVKLANEHGRITGDCKAELSWSNMTESDIVHYDVQRSDNDSVYTSIAQISPSSNTGNRADYKFTDPATNLTGTIYYRIKAVENTGQHYYSTTIRVTSCSKDAETKLSIYPNPARGGRFYLNVTELPQGKYDVLLFNSLGQMKTITTIDHNSGTLYKLFDLHWMAPGTYTLVLRSPDHQYSGKVVILNQ